jgi:LPS-assembly protein
VKVHEGEYQVDGLTFTPCDCNPTKPSWKITANGGNVKVNDRAILNWPVVYVRDVPVFAFPWLYLPLQDRETGLLFPHPTSTAQNGFSMDQPIYFTLGPSYDLTLTPGYYFGQIRPTSPPMAPR